MEILFYLFIFLIISSIPLLIYYLKNPNRNASIKDLYAEGLDMLVIGKRKSAYKIFKIIIQQDFITYLLGPYYEILDRNHLEIWFLLNTELH